MSTAAIIIETMYLYLYENHRLPIGKRTEKVLDAYFEKKVL